MAGATAALSTENLSPTIDTSTFSANDKFIIEEAFALALDYIPYRLRNKFDQTKLKGLPREYLVPHNPSTVAAKVRGLATHMEAEYPDLFESACTKLGITPATASTTFDSVAKEIFQTGTNWGRIVALFTFSGVVAHHFVVMDRPEMVPHVLEWIVNFIADHLLQWIRENGGWVSFRDIRILLYFLSVFFLFCFRRPAASCNIPMQISLIYISMNQKFIIKNIRLLLVWNSYFYVNWHSKRCFFLSINSLVSAKCFRPQVLPWPAVTIINYNYVFQLFEVYGSECHGCARKNTHFPAFCVPPFG